MVDAVTLCIAGMHRSGTSMITRLQYLCGMSLGEQSAILPRRPENPEGFWENTDFLSINEGILTKLGGGWDFPPPLERGWPSRPELLHFRAEATALLDQFEPYAFWGWKDPRNSFTPPFWRQLAGSLKVLVCVGNPLEVAQSLNRRNFLSLALSFHLWKQYNRALLSNVAASDRLVTHYDVCFQYAEAELKRVLRWLGVDCSKQVIQRAAATASTRLRNHKATVERLLAESPSADVVGPYRELCGQAGPAFGLLPTEECPAEWIEKLHPPVLYW